MNSKNAILAVSFGTSFNSSRSITIGAIESTLAESFPQYTVRRAFTSGMIISKLKKRDSICIDNVDEALRKLADEGFTNVYIQPTHMIEGEEYDLIKATAESFSGRFAKISVGRALLSKEADLHSLAKILDTHTAEWAVSGTARVFMGHGTEHAVNPVYKKLQNVIESDGIPDMYIATVEASPTIRDIVRVLKTGNIKRAVLSPLMIVAGDHAVNDMAGSGEDSWKSILEREGVEVICRIEGLGSMYEVQQMIVEHCKEMTDR